MKITRRHFIRTTAAIGAPGSIAGVGSAVQKASAAVRVMTVEETKAEGMRYFAEHGYAQQEPAAIITGLPFNGGLNYDEHIAGPARALYLVQPCARVDDALKVDKRGALPLFTILGFVPSPQSLPQHRTKLLFDYLTGVAALDPKRLRATTTELARPLFPEFAKFGVREAQVRLRSRRSE